MPARTTQGVPRGARGFTLIEMLVVLVILGLVAGLVIARGPSRSPGFLLRSEAQVLALRLGEARGRAISTDRDVAVRLTANPPGLAIAGVRPAHLPRGLALGLLTADDRAAPPGAQLVFHPDGGASGGGLLLSGEAGRLEIRVEWLSGRITVAAP